MNRKEFIEKVGLHNKYVNKICIIEGVFFFVNFVLFVFCVVKKSSIYYGNKIFIPCIMVATFANIAVFIWLNIRDMRRIGLFCPKCNKLIDMKESKKFINNNICQNELFTLNCRKCGEIIITKNSTSQ